MKNEADNLRESLWRRKISAAERAAVQARPDLELEARLTQALTQMPDAPVASNFTSRVLQEIAREESRAACASGWRRPWRRLWPRLAFAAALLVCAGVLFQRHEANTQRLMLAKDVAAVAMAQPPPTVEALDNFEAIRRMSQRGDGELLALLQ